MPQCTRYVGMLKHLLYYTVEIIFKNQANAVYKVISYVLIPISIQYTYRLMWCFGFANNYRYIIML